MTASAVVVRPGEPAVVLFVDRDERERVIGKEGGGLVGRLRAQGHHRMVARS